MALARTPDVTPKVTAIVAPGISPLRHAGPVSTSPKEPCLQDAAVSKQAIEDFKAAVQKAVGAAKAGVQADPQTLRKTIAAYGALRSLFEELTARCQEAEEALEGSLQKSVEDEMQLLNKEIAIEEAMHAMRVTSLCKQKDELMSPVRIETKWPVWEPDDTVPPDYKHPVDLDIHNKLVSFYQFYNPSKLPTIVNTLLKYAGRADEMFEVLTSKYGPEPPMQDAPIPCSWRRRHNHRGDFYYCDENGARQWARP